MEGWRVHAALRGIGMLASLLPGGSCSQQSPFCTFLGFTSVSLVGTDYHGDVRFSYCSLLAGGTEAGARGPCQRSLLGFQAGFMSSS